MIRGILKDDIKDVPYGKITHDEVSIVPCSADIIACNNIIINLAVLTNDGLNIINNKIGTAIKANNNDIRIKFNTSFGFDDKLYAIISRPNIKIPAVLILAYKQI